MKVCVCVCMFGLFVFCVKKEKEERQRGGEERGVIQVALIHEINQ